MADVRGRPAGGERRFAIVASRFNALVTEKLADGARACLLQHGVPEEAIDAAWVPGAWELPVAAAALARTGRYAGIVAVGCVIRGETAHFEYIAGEAARGLGAVALETGVPVGFGVLTTEDEQQALARAGGAAGNKGWEAAISALETADVIAQVRGVGAGA